MTTIAYLEATKLTPKRQLYDVWLDGERLVTGCRDPEHEACRALLARGITGPVEFNDYNTRKPRMSYRSIEAAAKLTVTEEAGGSHIRRWKPFPGGPVSP